MYDAWEEAALAATVEAMEEDPQLAEYEAWEEAALAATVDAYDAGERQRQEAERREARREAERQRQEEERRRHEEENRVWEQLPQIKGCCASVPQTEVPAPIWGLPVEML
jgi:hypothetical protein